MKTVVYATLYRIPKTDTYVVVVIFEDETTQQYGPVSLEEARKFFNSMFGKI